MRSQNNVIKKVKQILDNLKINKAPIPVEKVAEFFSLKVVYYPKFPDSISGTIIQQEDLNAIGVNSKQHPVRQRFSISHELGHYLLGHDQSHIIDDTFDEPTNKEREANEFAAELLMPIGILKKDITEKKWDIPSLAKYYEVSEQAMSIRLLETGLINKIKAPKK
jgi:Zn-dependent peptidase ImmA (M78 family)